jgi:ADP-heptose:LPS heptosyltransferase
VTPAESILLVRLDGIGDAALSIPALEGLRRAFPAATFGAVCSPANAALFSAQVERIHVYHPGQRVFALRDELVSSAYTKALVATEEVAGYQIARLSGAAERAGFWHRLHKPFKSLWQRWQVTAPVYRPAAWTKSPEHEVETLYRLAQALGATKPVPRDAVSLRTWLRTEPSPDATAASGAIGFQISPKLLDAGLGVSGFSTIVQTTLETLGDPPAVLIASETDEGLACAILERMPARQGSGKVRVVASLPLAQWIGVLDALDILVTPDTGAAHVAGMLGRRVIDIFNRRDFERLSDQWHPWAGSWLCHAKRTLTMQSDAETYGRFLASQIQLVRSQQYATQAASPSS